MIKPNPLPLQRLFLQIENAGIYVGPAERLRVQHLLASSLDAWLTEEGREDLKYQLAPLLCRNRVEQEQFHKIYDDFLEWLAEPLPDPPREVPELDEDLRKNKAPRWKKRLWWGMGAIVLGLVAYYIYHEFNRPTQKREVKVTFKEREGKSEFIVGQKGVFKNTTPREDTTGVRFEWWIYEASGMGGNSYSEKTDSLSYTASAIGNGYITDWYIQLKAYDRNTNELLGISNEPGGRIFCPTRPQTQGNIRSEGENQVRQTINFFAPDDLKKGWVTKWDFGDGETSFLRNPEHVFKEKRNYRVVLEIIDTTQIGSCFLFLTTQIQINDDFPQLAQQALIRDDLKPLWAYTALGWILAVLLLACSIYFFWKWWQRPVELEELPEPEVSKALKRAFEPSDRAPYGIPYKLNNSQVRLAAQQLEMATTLRRPQAGLLKQLHVQRSITATIEKAGFVDLRFALNTRPTQYLFLIDLQNESSHQAQLFKYLAEILTGQEVLAEVFFYKNDLDRFWSHTRPEGISIEHLAMNYGDYRLVVFGDAYRLLSANIESGEKLNPQIAEGLKRWSRRMLVTPVPIASWSYKEARLYRLFAVFHADLLGLMEAARYAEKDMDEESLPPSFAEWERQSIKIRKQSKVDVDTGQLWRSADDHRKYINQSRFSEVEKKKIYAWLRALVVYPELNWNMTIAIGKKLGIEVSYEHLLLLARIPWLQEGVIRAPLWREWWYELHEQDQSEEITIREAIQAELRAVADKTVNSFAEQKVQTRLAVQDFGLGSGEPNNQEAIRYILGNSKPSPQLREELNLVVKRYQPDFPVVDDNPAGNTIDAFVAHRHKRYRKRLYLIDRQGIVINEQQLKSSNFIANLFFWLGGLCGVASMCCFYLLLFVHPESFHTYFHKDHNEKPEPPPYRDLAVFQRPEAEDEAVRLNNMAVDEWNGLKSKGGTLLSLVGPAQITSNVIILLDSAWHIRPDYQLAQTNRARVSYNNGVYSLETERNPSRAIPYFRQALQNDTIHLLALEGLVLAYYQNDQLDLACAWMDTLTHANKQYYNWLAAKGECGKPLQINILVLDDATGQALGNAKLISPNLPDLASGPSGLIHHTFLPKMSMPKVSIRLQKQGYLDWAGVLIPNNNGRVDTIYLGKDRDSDGVIDKLDKCPDVPGAIQANGCPDIDEDGVPDEQDKCPDKPGRIDNGGCPVDGDRDNDGVPDSSDKCPDAKGPIDLSGCPDADSDGVPDAEDKCPTRPGKIEDDGCPIEVIPPKVRLKTELPSEPLVREALQDFAFDNNAAVSEDEAQRILQHLGVTNVQRSQALAGEPFFYGQFESGACVTIWVGTYEKLDRYGMRYGQCDERLSYHSSNDSYFEIVRPNLAGTLPLFVEYSSDDRVNCVAFSPNGEYIAYGGHDKVITVSPLGAIGNSIILQGHDDIIWSVAFSPAGNNILTSSYDGTAKVWNLQSGQNIATFEDGEQMFDTNFSPDSKSIATVSQKGIIIWDVENGKEKLTLPTQTRGITTVVFSPNGTKIGSVDYNNSIKIWNVENPKDTMLLRSDSHAIWSFDISSDGRKIVAGTAEGDAIIWDLETGKNILTLKGHSSAIRCVKFSPNGLLIATGSTDNTAKLWDARSGRNLATISEHSDEVKSVAFSPDERYIATGSWDKTVKVWRLK